MGIQNFPAALQPIIQQGFLERAFQEPLESVLAYRKGAEREEFPNQIGETITKTRAGLKTPVTTPSTPSANTNLDNGITPSTWTVEQYTLTINQYDDAIDLNIVSQKVGIEDQFLKNARVNGTQAAQSLDRLARNALFDSYMGGQTSVRTTLGSPAATIAVDDIRGFQTALTTTGQPVAVSPSNPMTVTVGSNVYTLNSATPDGSNVSKAFRGISGTLTFSGNVTVLDATAGNAVTSAVSPTILRAGGATTTAALVSGGFMTMSMALDAVAQLRNNAVPDIDGLYNCHLDPTSARQLFADPDFKQLYQGRGAAMEFRSARVLELLDLRFISTTEAPIQVHPTLSNLKVRRPIVYGSGCLIEGDFAGMSEAVSNDEDDLVDVVDGVVQVTREPLDRLKQIVSQAWFWIGGFTCPTDYTTNAAIVPTASAAYFKRAVVLETVGA